MNVPALPTAGTLLASKNHRFGRPMPAAVVHDGPVMVCAKKFGRTEFCDADQDSARKVLRHGLLVIELVRHIEDVSVQDGDAAWVSSIAEDFSIARLNTVGQQLDRLPSFPSGLPRSLVDRAAGTRTVRLSPDVFAMAYVTSGFSDHGGDFAAAEEAWLAEVAAREARNELQRQDNERATAARNRLRQFVDGKVESNQWGDVVLSADAAERLLALIPTSDA